MIDRETRYYGVLGYPARSSRSPCLFNQLFRDYQINAIYLFLEQRDTQKAVEAIRTLHYAGASVTLPHKIAVLSHLDEIDPLAARLKCVNTIVNKDGRLWGYNFDGLGAIEGLEREEPDWRGKNILILGNGGAARGIAMTMASRYRIPRLHFLVRDPKRVELLVRELETEETRAEIYTRQTCDGIIKEDIHIIINTTPVGMAPFNEETPIDKCYLRSSMVVYDIVYTPRETRLLREARAAGSRVVYGEEMFIGQAARQFELWTGIVPDLKGMREKLTRCE